MKRTAIFLLLALLALVPVFSQSIVEVINTPLDKSDPVLATGTSIVYKGNTIQLGPKAIYLDGTISDADVAKYDYVFNDFIDAMQHVTEGTEDDPMKVYIAPNVYWLHDPDQAETDDPYGLSLRCPWMQWIGLTEDPYNVVIAANFGHNEGFMGSNWTMFRIMGDGFTLKNLTIGNYCNVDLVYPLDTSKNHAKRTDNITQAQTIHYKYDENGKGENFDKAYAENVNFISRLNLGPIAIQSGMRALYYKCHFESTDDALNSYGVYVDCDFEFYGTKPFGGANGAALLNCTFRSVLYNLVANPYQFMTKGAGVMTIVDGKFLDDYTIPVTLSWMENPSGTFRSYYSNVTRNGEPEDLVIDRPWTSVDITDTEFLKAFKLTDANGEVIYNVWNLMRGDDDWDPMNLRDKIEALGDYGNIPTVMSAKISKSAIESGEETAEITYTVQRFANKEYTGDFAVEYKVSEEDSKYVNLIPSADGTSCIVEGTNTEEEAVSVIITVKALTGQEVAVALSVSPTILPAPAVVSAPVVTIEDGKAKVTYQLDLDFRADYSDVTWYRADDAQGTGAIQVAVTRTNEPLCEYVLTEGDVGKYIIASVEPKHVRSRNGEAVSAASAAAVSEADVIKTNKFSTDFTSFPNAAQTISAPGYWTLDGFRPLDAQDESKFKNWGDQGVNCWSYAYGTLSSGATGYYGIYPSARGARMLYTPVGDTFGAMDVRVKAAPCKDAGQGFGSTYQYLDVMIKYDTTSQTGYGLRIVRSSGDSCDFVLMQYENGESKEISDRQTSSAYITECSIHVWFEGGKLNATVETTNAQAAVVAASKPNYVEKVSLSADVQDNGFGGFGFQHTGTLGANTTVFYGLDIEWN